MRDGVSGGGKRRRVGSENTFKGNCRHCYIVAIAMAIILTRALFTSQLIFISSFFHPHPHLHTHSFIQTYPTTRQFLIELAISAID